MFTINLEDGREVPSNASLFKWLFLNFLISPFNLKLEL